MGYTRYKKGVNMSRKEQEIINCARTGDDIWAVKNCFDMVPPTIGSAVVACSAVGVSVSSVIGPVILLGFIFGFVASTAFTLASTYSAKEKLIDSSVPLRFFSDDDAENTYAAFIQRVYPGLAPGALVIDTLSSEDDITITYKLDDQHRLEWLQPKNSVRGSDILAAKARSMTESNNGVVSDNQALKLSILLMANESSPVYCYHSRLRKSRATKWSYACTIATGIAGAILVVSLGFPPLALALLGLCMVVASIAGAAYGVSSYKLHKQSGVTATNVFSKESGENALSALKKKVAADCRDEMFVPLSIPDYVMPPLYY